LLLVEKLKSRLPLVAATVITSSSLAMETPGSTTAAPAFFFAGAACSGVASTAKAQPTRRHKAPGMAKAMRQSVYFTR
jgi:hypothetical protein